MRTNDRPLMELLKEIHAGYLQLPDFQRDWIWDDSLIRTLIASVTSGFPIGAVMFLETTQSGLQISCRPLAGAPAECGKTIPRELILDGQQRLTSLYAVLMSGKPVVVRSESGRKDRRYYYLDIRKALDPEYDREDAVLSLPESRILTADFGRKEELNLTDRCAEYRRMMFPLHILMDFQAVQEWQNGLYALSEYDPDTIRLFTEFMTRVVLPVMKYEVPVILLERDTPRETVCKVFENVNRGGVPLTVFELNTAMYAMDHFSLRKDWEEKREKQLNASLLTDLDPAAFLMACTLYSTCLSGAATCRKKDILNLSLKDYKASSGAVTDGFTEAVKFLEEERIFSSRDLPYASQLIPLAVLCALLDRAGALRRQTCRQMLRRWYWCGVFGEMYGSATESRYAMDVTETMAWILNQGAEPSTVRDASFTERRLVALQGRGSAAYRGILALILQHHARDLMSGREMDFTFFLSENVDMHHIFPKGWCIREGIPKEKWNNIINRTPVSYSTNRAVGGSAPSKYLDRIEFRQIISRDDMDACLQSHGIPVEAIRSDDFGSFYQQRMAWLMAAVASAMGK